jgi:hypothetical protein
MNDEKKSEQTNDTTVYYVLGGVVLIAVIAAVYFLRPKAPATQTPDAGTPVTAAQNPVNVAPGPITKLACDKQYYNPVVGFKQYFLSAEGGDLDPTKEVTCVMNISVDNKFVSKETVKATAVAAPERGGVTFKCTTGKVELKPNVPTKVDVELTNDHGGSGSCSATFLLP